MFVQISINLVRNPIFSLPRSEWVHAATFIWICKLFQLFSQSKLFSNIFYYKNNKLIHHNIVIRISNFKRLQFGTQFFNVSYDFDCVHAQKTSHDFVSHVLNICSILLVAVMQAYVSGRNGSECPKLTQLATILCVW